jgi:hypothetical protein
MSTVQVVMSFVFLVLLLRFAFVLRDKWNKINQMLFSLFQEIGNSVLQIDG